MRLNDVPPFDYEKTAEDTAKKAIERFAGAGDNIITQTLVEAMCRGDQGAFDRIYLHSYDKLKEFLTVLLHSKEDAEEIVHDVFLHILDNREKIDPAKSFKGYLYSIAKTKALMLLRRKRMDEKYLNYRENAPDDLAFSPEEMVMTDELALMINIYIEKMPPQRRQVFELSKIEGKSIKEISQIMGLGQQTVKNYLQAAMKGLGDLITIFIILFVTQ